MRINKYELNAIAKAIVGPVIIAAAMFWTAGTLRRSAPGSRLFAITWAMVANRHFEPGVRIQRDREHGVVSTGPYRLVRHPGYTGTIAAYFLGMPCMLGSLASLIAAALGIVVLIVRTAKEDAFLVRELAGYASYASRVRYRLLPSVY